MDIYMIEVILFIILLISSPFLLFSFANAGTKEHR